LTEAERAIERDKTRGARWRSYGGAREYRVHNETAAIAQNSKKSGNTSVTPTPEKKEARTGRHVRRGLRYGAKGLGKEIHRELFLERRSESRGGRPAKISPTENKSRPGHRLKLRTGLGISYLTQLNSTKAPTTGGGFLRRHHTKPANLAIASLRLVSTAQRTQPR